MAESQKGVSPTSELERGGVVEVPVEEESVDVTAELAALRAKYAADGQPAPKRRGRRPKAAPVQAEPPHEAEQE